MTPHMYAKEIHAWAEGETIEYRNPKELDPEWKEIRNPSWVNGVEYRIKPEKVKLLYRRYISQNGGRPQVLCHAFEQRHLFVPEETPGFIRYIDNIWLMEEVVNE